MALRAGIEQLWAALTRVPPSADQQELARARFLAALLVVSMPMVVLVGLVLLPLWTKGQAGQAGVQAAAIVAFVAMMLALLLNRRGWRLVAAALMIAATAVTITWASTLHPSLLVFSSVLTLFAIGLLPLKLAVIFCIAELVVAHPLVLLLSSATLADLAVPFCLNLFVFPVAVVVEVHHLDLERRRRNQLERRERWFSTTLSSIGDAVLTVDRDRRLTFLNPVAEALTGWSRDEALGRSVTEVFDIVNEATGQPAQSPIEEVLREGVIVGLANHTELIARDGTRRPIADSGAPIVDAQGVIYGVVLVFRDVSVERELHSQLAHAQRLDALGQLAGSIAHDFNNLLTAIGGGAELALDLLPSGHQVRVDLEDVLDATRRAVALTSQLLAFSRRQIMQPRALELNAAILGSQRLLRRLVREDVTIVCELDEHAGWTLVDPVQFEQVLLNLVINANDAMTKGGKLALSTASVMVSEQAPLLSLEPGEYGRISVSDTGVGIDASLLEHLFEPFFTTKDRGRGTGLGLATVHGIVRQSGGAVSVRSEPEQGTTFDVYLPSTDAVVSPASPRHVARTQASEDTTHSVFVVEDDDMVRRFVVRALADSGYRLLQASSGDDALAQLDGELGAVDLLITDIVMPGCNGPAVAARFRARFPALRVLFMSGYADEIVAREGVSTEGSSFIAKPYTPTAFRNAVHEALRARD